MMSVRPICEVEGAFLDRVRWKNGQPGNRPVDEIDPVPDHMLHRLPGLFRRWELAQVIETGKDYRFEDAGSACDGTTLYAVYIGAAAVPEAEIEKDLELPSRPGIGWRRGKSCAVAEAAGPVSEDRVEMPVGQMKAVR